MSAEEAVQTALMEMLRANAGVQAVFGSPARVFDAESKAPLFAAFASEPGLLSRLVILGMLQCGAITSPQLIESFTQCLGRSLAEFTASNHALERFMKNIL